MSQSLQNCSFERVHDTYGSLAAGRDFWATSVQKVRHVVASGDFIFGDNLFSQVIPPIYGFGMAQKKFETPFPL